MEKEKITEEQLITEDGDVVKASELVSYINRIECLNTEKESLVNDIREVYTEMQSKGYGKKTISAIRQLILVRKNGKTEHEQKESLMSQLSQLIGEK